MIYTTKISKKWYLCFFFIRYRYTGASTATGAALEYVRNYLVFNAAAGARNDAKKIVIVITDGKSNHGVSPITPAAQLRSRGVINYVIGITPNTLQSELNAIAGSEQRVFHIDHYATVDKMTKEIQGGTRNGITLKSLEAQAVA